VKLVQFMVLVWILNSLKNDLYKLIFMDEYLKKRGKVLEPSEFLKTNNLGLRKE
jgi:hypothetical protein